MAILPTLVEEYCKTFNEEAQEAANFYEQDGYKLVFMYSCEADVTTPKEAKYRYTLTIANYGKNQVKLSLGNTKPFTIKKNGVAQLKNSYEIPLKIDGVIPIIVRENAQKLKVFLIEGIVPAEDKKPKYSL